MNAAAKELRVYETSVIRARIPALAACAAFLSVARFKSVNSSRATTLVEVPCAPFVDARVLVKNWFAPAIMGGHRLRFRGTGVAA